MSSLYDIFSDFPEYGDRRVTSHDNFVAELERIKHAPMEPDEVMALLRGGEIDTLGSTYLRVCREVAQGNRDMIIRVSGLPQTLSTFKTTLKGLIYV